MLRQSFLNKYKEKSKYGEDRFYQEDEGFLLKQNRPIKPNYINKLKEEKIHQFIEDVLSNKKLTSVLYASNAKVEIKAYNRIKNNFYRKKDELERKLKEKNEPSSVVKRRSRKEAYIKMRNEISNFKITKEKHKRTLTHSNYKKIKKLKEEVEKERKEYFDDIRSNFIKGYRRAFSKLKFKLDILKLGTGGGFLETMVDYPYAFEFTSHNIKFPHAKLNVKNVYSRLYNNAVFLPKDFDNNKIPNEKHRKRAKSAKNPHIENTLENPEQKKIIKFKLKNALKCNQGKEFTTKINNTLFKKCHNKYSGGPDTIKYLKTETEKKCIDEKNTYFVNYYNLVDPQTGNSFLHMAAIEDIPQMAKYFVEKGANLNMQNKEGNTPLHLALICKNDRVIKILMDNKAALDVPNSKGEIPFDYFTSEMKKKYGVDTMLVLNPTKKK